MSDETVRGFGVKVLDDLDAKVDCVIVTVAHDEFKEVGLMDVERLMPMDETPVLVDVRGMFDRVEAERSGIYYRRL
ncbi:MAG: hypothetical protein AEth_01058 [Candidatus Argoarchaeum ethanivorans]|uniref:UDP-glucose/GDP-mannose dehydrogenase C-terminal domain-containing protein n=1 Tax=Candidatus Argoarchaeum ethanivorans TaxID=2608793 RepID=A0A8B3S1K2_9EURY|nr:MAG: hypothetical protein AEth_01058 [Candidatus Argoarchaeum ethanivorans]